MTMVKLLGLRRKQEMSQLDIKKTNTLKFLGQQYS